MTVDSKQKTVQTLSHRRVDFPSKTPCHACGKLNKRTVGDEFQRCDTGGEKMRGEEEC